MPHPVESGAPTANSILSDCPWNYLDTLWCQEAHSDRPRARSLSKPQYDSLDRESFLNNVHCEQRALLWNHCFVMESGNRTKISAQC